MKLVEIGTDQQSLQACAALLQAAFPNAPHLNTAYLQWLYVKNPAGLVVGYNAWEGDKIVGHYACIPVNMYLAGKACVGLLALNTAMHPEYRNAGVIYSLAKRTLKLAREQGFACIYAVANKASTPIFIKALGFQLVSQLTAAVGITTLRPDWKIALVDNRFRRRWTAASASWRAANPSNPSWLQQNNADTILFRAKTHIPGIFACGLMPVEPPLPECSKGPGLGLNLFLGLLPEGSCQYPRYLHVPERLKPSPLNFIYRPLSELAPPQLQRNEVILGLHDFDPY
jgi:hypothetical protein